MDIHYQVKKIICIDGDVYFLTHLGSNKTFGKIEKKNFKYILLNNNSHDSVGGQSTFIDKVNLDKFSKSMGFDKFYLIQDKKNLKNKIKSFLNNDSLSFLEVKDFKQSD